MMLLLVLAALASVAAAQDEEPLFLNGVNEDMSAIEQALPGAPPQDDAAG
jgi:hypothetical protein